MTQESRGGFRENISVGNISGMSGRVACLPLRRREAGDSLSCFLFRRQQHSNSKCLPDTDVAVTDTHTERRLDDERRKRERERVACTQPRISGSTGNGTRGIVEERARGSLLPLEQDCERATVSLSVTHLLDLRR